MSMMIFKSKGEIVCENSMYEIKMERIIEINKIHRYDLIRSN